MSRRARAAFDAATQVEELHAARAKILGKDGELTGVLQNLGQLSGNKRRDYGLRANDVRFEIDQAFEAKLSSLTSGGWSL
jgi:phenylalanyl-tRNA synthetase alpha chain